MHFSCFIFILRVKAKEVETSENPLESNGVGASVIQLFVLEGTNHQCFVDGHLVLRENLCKNWAELTMQGLL